MRFLCLKFRESNVFTNKENTKEMHDLTKFTLTHFWQKFRESNVFTTEENTKEMI